MIEWFLYLQLVLASAAGLLCVVLGLVGKAPNDLTMGVLALVELGLVVQLIITIVAPLTGNNPTGSLGEFYIYLISAVLLPLAGGVWALLERNRWSTVVLGVVALSIAIMLYRMGQIWFVQLV